MLNKIVREKLGILEKVLKKESSVPLVNRLIGDDASEKLTYTWMHRSWAELTHSDLVEKSDALHYRRVLKTAQNETLDDIKRHLDMNVYAEMIMELILQIYEEQVSMNRLDALYLLEMTLELGKVEGGVPTQTSLLNMMHRNYEEFGSLALLKIRERPKERIRPQVLEEVEGMASNDLGSSEILPAVDLESTLNSDAALSHKQDCLDVVRGDKSHMQKLTHEYERGELSDSQLLYSEDMIDAVDRQERLQEMADAATMVSYECTSNQNRLMLIDTWEQLEERIQAKVSAMLNDSIRMKKFKEELWQRQQYAEMILDYTEECCDDDEIKMKYHEEMMKMRPLFRAEMGKKISARPEVAEKIYDILNRMMEQEISAFDYIHVAIALAKNPYDIAVTIIECDLVNDGETYKSANNIIETLNSFNERCQGMSTGAAKALSERQLQLWEYTSR